MGVSIIKNKFEALTTEEHDWLEAMYDERSAIPNKNDIDPGRQGLYHSDAFLAQKYNKSSSVRIPVAGFSKISMKPVYNSASSDNGVKYTFVDSLGNDIGTSTNLTVNTWSDYINIPSNAVAININSYEKYYSYGQVFTTYYSIIV